MLSKRVIIISLLVASVGFLTSINARAQTLTSARILSSEGAVEIQRRSQGQATLVKIEYRVNDELLAGDVIKTLKGGRLVLGLTDGSQAIIGERTTVEIVDLSQSPRTIFNVLRGKTRIKIEKVGGRPNPYRVNTPTAVIAVRGTLFDVLVTERETQVFVHEGEVVVSNLTSPEERVILLPGLRTRVQQAQPPEPPSRFQPGRNNDTFNPHPPDRNQNGGDAGERGANEPSSRPPGAGDRPRQSDPTSRDADGHDQNKPGAGAPPPGGQPDGGKKPHEQFFSDDEQPEI